MSERLKTKDAHTALKAALNKSVCQTNDVYGMEWNDVIGRKNWINYTNIQGSL